MSQIHRDELKVARERAVLVAVELPGDRLPFDDRMHELEALVSTAGAEVVGHLRQRRRLPSGRSFIGKGKLEELHGLVELVKATIVIFDHDLTPAQVRNIELETCCKIIDRSELILDIFARRATTHAARLQVEIAQLEYTYPRLRAMWDHLGQVTGGAPVGIGTRGPGEQQLEIDRRLVQRRRKQLRNELNTILSRKEREVASRNQDHFTVGLVGYTNAGKSTLFNRVSDGGGAFANDKLFATLSSRVEKWNIGTGTSVLVSDTVGFIRDLPHHLIASFRSTLEETVHGQLLLLVLDVADPMAREQLRIVEETLDSIGAIEQPRVLVLNQVDRLQRPDDLLPWLKDFPDAVPLSAKTGEGSEELSQRVLEIVLGPQSEIEIEVPLASGRIVEFLERRTEILDRRYEDNRVFYTVRLGRRQGEQLLARGNDARVDGKHLREAFETLWPAQAWGGSPVKGRDGVLEDSVADSGGSSGN
ncbi:MAG: GTPase HflX [Phycisphaerales bacterium]|nr:GTPase HflX [Phycisphaerales bacterium]